MEAEESTNFHAEAVEAHDEYAGRGHSPHGLSAVNG
jgi:hypothetical protein